MRKDKEYKLSWNFIFTIFIPILLLVLTNSISNSENVFIEKNRDLINLCLDILSLLSTFYGLFRFLKTFQKHDDLFKWIKKYKTDFDALQNQINNIALYRQYDENKLSISVSNLDDYFILMPLHLSRETSKGMKLEINTKPCSSDKLAIEEVNKGNCMFAIADPSYLKEYKNDESSNLVLLSPLIQKVPLWLLEKKKNRTIGKKKLLTITKDSDIFTGRIVNENFSACDITTTDEFEKELLTIFQEDIYYDESTLNNIFKIRSDKASNNDSKKRSLFSILLFSYADNKWKKETKEKIRWKIEEFDYIFLTDPEVSFIKSITEKEKYCVQSDKFSSQVISKTCAKDEHGNLIEYSDPTVEKRAEEGIIFSALIANRKMMENYYTTTIRFLRSLQVGILKTNIALSTNEDGQDISNAFINSLKAEKEKEKEYLAEIYQNALRVLKGDKKHLKDYLFLQESYYPNDLYIFTRDTNLFGITLQEIEGKDKFTLTNEEVDSQNQNNVEKGTIKYIFHS